MKTIIVYSSRYGVTKKCVTSLENSLLTETTRINIDNSDTSAIDLTAYDTVVIGGGIHLGRISKKLSNFCQDNLEELLKKQVGIFLCCGFSEEFSTYLEANFPESLLAKAVIATNFGGEADLDKMSFIDKLVVKAALKNRPEPLRLNRKNIDLFTQRLNDASSSYSS